MNTTSSPPPPPPAGARLRTRGIIGLVVLALLVGGVLYLILARDPLNRDESRFIVYFDGNADLSEETSVFFRRANVGAVDSVNPGLPSLQVIARRLGPFPNRDVATIGVGQSARLDGGTEVTLDADTAVTIRSAGATLHLRSSFDGTLWYIPAADAAVATSFMINDVPLARAEVSRQVDGIVLLEGDELGAGALRFEWRPPARYTRVSLRVNQDAIRKLANTSQVMGPGSTVALSSTFGLTTPVLNLEPAYETEKIFLSAGNELIPEVDINIQQVVNQAGGYLMHRQFLRTPPRNRFERVVSDLNTSLEDVRLVTDRIRDYSLTDSRFRSKAANNIEDIIANVDSTIMGVNLSIARVSTNLNSEVSAISGDLRHSTIPVTNEAVKALVKRLEEAIATVEAELARLREMLKPPVDNASRTITSLDISASESLENLSILLRRLDATLVSLQGKLR